MADENITILVLLKAKDNLIEQVKQKLLTYVEPSRSETSCISYDLHQNTQDQSCFMFYENWTSKQTLDDHIQTPSVQAFLAEADQLLVEPPDITTWKKLS